MKTYENLSVSKRMEALITLFKTIHFQIKCAENEESNLNIFVVQPIFINIDSKAEFAFRADYYGGAVEM